MSWCPRSRICPGPLNRC